MEHTDPSDQSTTYSNIVQPNMLIVNNNRAEIPSPISFMMGLMIPIILLIIPFTLFSIEESIGEELKFSYGEGHLLVTLEKIDGTEYSGNFSSLLEKEYSDTRIIDCGIEITEYGGEFEEIEGRLTQPDYRDRILQHACKPYNMENESAENYTIISIPKGDVMSNSILDLEIHKNTTVNYSINLNQSESIAVASLSLIFIDENGTSDDRYFTTFNQSNGLADIFYNGDDISYLGYVDRYGNVVFNNTGNISTIYLEYIVVTSIGYWTLDGYVQFDDANDHGQNINIAFYTVSEKLRIENEVLDSQLMSEQRDVAGYGYISCCAILLTSLMLTIYGFASRGGIPMAIGGLLSFIVCPIIFVIPANFP